MAGGGGLRHVVHRRVHLERPQPSARKKFGYLEKHKDYVKRAKDFHKKEDHIKTLHRKAYYKNEDEFHMGMLEHRIVKGKTKKKVEQLTKDQLLLLESQDAQYIGMREQTDKKAVAKRMESLHFLDADRPNKHTLFVDDEELEAAGGGAASSSAGGAGRSGVSAAKTKRLQDFDIAAHLDTHPAVLGRKANRPRRQQLETRNFEDSAELQASAKEAYKELYHRQERAKRLGHVREVFELRQHLRKKGKRTKVAEAAEGRPAQYRWMYERKK